LLLCLALNSFMSPPTMTKPDHCPKHGTSYVLRRNVKTGELVIACPLCEVEARGGSEEDRKLVADKIKSDPSQ
jgi:uncharacterized Zn finger protein (UPF0148 family)